MRLFQEYFSKGKEKKIILMPSSKTLNVADKPPLMGGLPKVIPTQDFISKVGMTEWCEGIVHQDQILPNGKRDDYQITPEILNVIEENAKKLLISYINDSVGYGIFALGTLAKNTPIAIYGGLLTSVDIKNDTVLNGYQLRFQKKELNLCVDARKIGNIARFFQHLPKEEQDSEICISLSDYKFQKSLNIAEIATENLTVILAEYQGYEVYLFLTNREVRVGEQLGWDYGKGYWRGPMPYLFNLKGDIIDSVLYQPERVILQVSGEKVDPAEVTISISSCQEMLQDFPMQINNFNGDTFVVNNNDFNLALSKHPHSFYLTISNPSEIRYADSPKPK